MMNAAQDIPLDRIRVDIRAQPRDHINLDKVTEYAEALGQGDTFPPIIVFFDGAVYWLADGFHRYHSAVAMELAAFACEVHPGGVRDAILYSVGANAQHGYARSNDDKRRAVRRLLDDPEWRDWSDREIAKRCRVGHPLVAKIRAELVVVTGINSSESDDRIFITKHGTEATMATAGINADRCDDDDFDEIVADAADEETNAPSLPFRTTDEIEADAAASEIRQDMTDNSFIAVRLWEIERIVNALPLPDDAANRFPGILAHSFSPERARAIRDWFDTFARAFDTREDRHVAAE